MGHWNRDKLQMNKRLNVKKPIKVLEENKSNEPNNHNTHKQSQKPKYKVETNIATYIMEKGLIP